MPSCALLQTSDPRAGDLKVRNPDGSETTKTCHVIEVSG